jgi:cytoskeletal protein RodZ
MPEVGGGKESTSNTPPLWSGELLRMTRKSLHLSVKDLSERTRIRRGLIEAIEQEDFKSLPAPAFTRGLIFQIAQALGLPEEEVAKHYMSRFSEGFDQVIAFGDQPSKGF